MRLNEDIVTGLSKGQKSIPPKYLYDKKGSEIFELICKLPEYYPTRCEFEILKDYAHEMASLIGPGALLIEPGSGSGEKIRFLLKELEDPAGLVPIEISSEILNRMTKEMEDEFPSLRIVPVCDDFTRDFELPELALNHRGKKIVFFPGSTIGNLNPDEGVLLLNKFANLVGKGGGLLIGVDLKKNKKILEEAYDDRPGITAAFNLNLLERINREMNGRFIVKNFKHEAFYNEEEGRVEMHLISLIDQQVPLGDITIGFRKGETIHTENSYKYTVEEFCHLAAKAHFTLRRTWKDAKNLFCLYYFENLPGKAC